MLERPLRWISVAATLVVLAGWIAFAVTETSAASKVSVAEVGGSAVTYAPGAEEVDRGGLRGALDDVNGALLSPFSMLGGGSDDAWVAHSLPALAALLAYGLGLGTLARFSRGRA